MPISTHLAALEQAGLIRPSASDSPDEYTFRHVLSQEAAYQSLLKNERRHLHLAVGNCLERLGADHAVLIAPTLAQHFLSAGEDARALPYLEMATGEAARRYANTEAITFLDRAIEATTRLGLPVARCAELTIKRGRLLELSSRYPEALASYEEIARQAHDAGDEATWLAALMAQATVHCAPTSHFDSTKGEAEVTQALAIARRLRDRAAECKALWLQMLRCKWITDDQHALGYAEQSIAIARELGLKELLAYALIDTVLIHKRLGHTDAAEAAIREAVSLWRELGNLPMLADGLINIGELGRTSGKFKGADAPVVEALGIAEKIQNTWGLSFGRMVLGMLRSEECRFSEALEHLEASVRLGKQAGFVMGQIISCAAMAMLYAELGQPARGMAIAQEGAQIAGSAMPAWRGLPLAARALCQVSLGSADEAHRAIEAAARESSPYHQMFVLPRQCSLQMRLAQGEFQEALDEARQVCELLRSSGQDLNIPRTSMFVAEALLGLGRLDEAAATLHEAIDLARESGARRGLWHAYVLLAACETRRGNPDAAHNARAAAREEIGFITAHLPEDGLRHAFEQQAQVRAVLASA